ncbi:hypothetical protein RJT34_24737 [Clitoria ternatea]|uniref:Uncharacterized protein n=1 Tax=Clitoria ternatea TaxID=43366 RepID=A0AAN9FNS5_CLITE
MKRTEELLIPIPSFLSLSLSLSPLACASCKPPKVLGIQSCGYELLGKFTLILNVFDLIVLRFHSILFVIILGIGLTESSTVSAS